MKRSSGPRKTANFSESIHQQLNMSVRAAGAAGSSYVLAAPSPSGLPHFRIPTISVPAIRQSNATCAKDVSNQEIGSSNVQPAGGHRLVRSRFPAPKLQSL
jgi:hypothetical protein